MENNFFGYMRISTKEERQKQKFIRQESSLLKFSKDNNFEYIQMFSEDVSGKSFENRKQWRKLERLIYEGDTIVFKDISRFTRETENGYIKYMELFDKGIELIFIDNPTVSTPYIRKMLDIAKKQNLIAKITLENTIKLLLMVELDRVEQERLITVKRIKDGIQASTKKQGRKQGQLDKMTDELEQDIKQFLNDRTMKQIDLMRKYDISRNTLKKYVEIIRKENNQ